MIVSIQSLRLVIQSIFLSLAVLLSLAGLGNAVAEEATIPPNNAITLSYLKLQQPILYDSKPFKEARFIQNFMISGASLNILTLSNGAQTECIAFVRNNKLKTCETITRDIKETINAKYKFEIIDNGGKSWCSLVSGIFDIKRIESGSVLETQQGKVIPAKLEKPLPSLNSLQDFLKANIGECEQEVRAVSPIPLPQPIQQEQKPQETTVNSRDEISSPPTRIYSSPDKIALDEIQQDIQKIKASISPDNKFSFFWMIIAICAIVTLLLIDRLIILIKWLLSIIRLSNINKNKFVFTDVIVRPSLPPFGSPTISYATLVGGTLAFPRVSQQSKKKVLPSTPSQPDDSITSYLDYIQSDVNEIKRLIQELTSQTPDHSKPGSKKLEETNHLSSHSATVLANDLLRTLGQELAKFQDSLAKLRQDFEKSETKEYLNNLIQQGTLQATVKALQEERDSLKKTIGSYQDINKEYDSQFSLVKQEWIDIWKQLNVNDVSSLPSNYKVETSTQSSSHTSIKYKNKFGFWNDVKSLIEKLVGWALDCNRLSTESQRNRAIEQGLSADADDKTVEKFCAFLDNDKGVSEGFRRSLVDLQNLLEQNDINFQDCELLDIENLKAKLMKYKPFDLVNIERDPLARLNEYIVDRGVFAEVIETIFKTLARLNAYCPDQKSTPLARKLDSTESRLRETLAKVGIYPDHITLCTQVAEDLKRATINKGEEHVVQTNNRFITTMQKAFKDKDTKTDLVSDVQKWGYTKGGKRCRDSIVYVRDQSPQLTRGTEHETDKFDD